MRRNGSMLCCSFVVVLLCWSHIPTGVSRKEIPLIFTEHVDFIYVRLHHLLDQAPEDITLLRALLQKELDESPAYKEAWTEGAELFARKKSELVDGGDEGKIPEEYHIALITYTLHDTPKDTPFFSLFNTATSNVCSGTQVEKFPYKSFFQLLRLAIRTLNSKPKFMPPCGSLYRGMTLRYDFKVGTQVAFQQFTSLSGNRTVSEIYSNNVTLMEFRKMTHTGISMGLHSKFPGNAEVLVSPLQIYKVKEVNHGKGRHDTFTLQPMEQAPEFKYLKGEASINFSHLGLVAFILPIFYNNML